MLSFRASLASLLSAAILATSAFATTTTHRSASSTHRHSRHVVKQTSHRLHGQQAIGSERVTEIQQALIREHYLTGEATGSWDASTAAAMQKYQADQGWQTKLMPDSRALKKLGLGPDYSNAINAKDASFGDPHAANPLPPTQAAAFAAAAGVSR